MAWPLREEWPSHFPFYQLRLEPQVQELRSLISCEVLREFHSFPVPCGLDLMPCHLSHRRPPRGGGLQTWPHHLGLWGSRNGFPQDLHFGWPEHVEKVRMLRYVFQFASERMWALLKHQQLEGSLDLRGVPKASQLCVDALRCRQNIRDLCRCVRLSAAEMPRLGE